MRGYKKAYVYMEMVNGNATELSMACLQYVSKIVEENG